MFRNNVVLFKHFYVGNELQNTKLFLNNPKVGGSFVERLYFEPGHFWRGSVVPVVGVQFPGVECESERNDGLKTIIYKEL